MRVLPSTSSGADSQRNQVIDKIKGQASISQLRELKEQLQQAESKVAQITSEKKGLAEQLQVLRDEREQSGDELKLQL